jgi:hypothetical protein
LSPEQLKERLDAAAEDKKAEFDDEDEEKFADENAAPAEANQPGPREAGAGAPAVGAAAGIGAFALFVGMLFSPIDGLFILLAVATAYKVGSGKMTG